MTERFYVKGTKIKEHGKEGWYTIDEICALLNKLDKDRNLLIKAIRKVDGSRLFDFSTISFADVLTKVLYEE